MRKILIYIMLFLILIPNIAYSTNMSLSTSNYILIEEKSGRVLMEKNSHRELPMASTTKIMTAILAIEEGNLDDEITIVGKDINIEGSSIFLKDEEVITLKDLIYGLMLRSGNDSAIAIANHISGSVEDFAKLMNKKAKEIGALNTNFMNPHGLHHKDHYSSAYDLALITSYAFKNDIFKEISTSKNYRTSSAREYNYFVNKNKTLWDYEGGDGVKIGYTMSAGRCLVASATKSNMRLIAVVLNDYNWFNDSYKLMDYGFNNYRIYPIYTKHQLIKKIDISNGSKDSIPLIAKNDFLYPLTDDEIDKIKLSVIIKKNIELPIKKNEELGTIEVYLDGILINEDKLVAKDSIKKESIIKRLLNVFSRESS